MNSLTEQEMYDAVIRNDANYDGLFFYGVKSTGIFCRPSCPSKKPRRENVEFFMTGQEAMAAGYRPCKRCRSDLLIYHPMEELAKEIKNRIDSLYSERRKWHDHIQKTGLSARRMTTIFKAAYGITPKVYRDGLRLKEAKRLLKNTDKKIIDIAAEAGFGSVTTFNRFFKNATGYTPAAYRKRRD